LWRRQSGGFQNTVIVGDDADEVTAEPDEAPRKAADLIGGPSV
jgi:hypothetical protein